MKIDKPLKRLVFVIMILASAAVVIDMAIALGFSFDVFRHFGIGGPL